MIGAAREAVPRDRLLIAGTGRESTRATIAATRRAAALGADAVLVRTPSFFRSRMTPAVLVRHFTAVADASPVPVLLYNFPAADRRELHARHRSRGWRSIRTSSASRKPGPTRRSSRRSSTPRRRRFSVLAGSAPGFYAALCVGAVGGVIAAACVVPELCVRLCER